ncbi:MAG: cytochrome c, partial [Betaproteobacteria bacterium]|nr:cytochrome c [Betaproteobacteria bacterium]
MATYKTSQRLTTLFSGLLLVLGSASDALADARGQWKDGKEAYEKTCGYCHEKGIGPKIKGYGRLPADI